MFVIVTYELALQPGLAIYERFLDPKDGEVTLKGEQLVDYPKLPEFQQVTLLAKQFRLDNERLVVKEAELVA
jgi:hypothetical protein